MENTSIIDTKKALRTRLIHQIKSIEPEIKPTLDKKILRRLQGVQQLQSANHVFCFVSTAHEVDTRRLIDWLLSKEKLLSVPKIWSNDMVPSRFNDWSMMQTNRFGIFEPVDQEVIKEEIDVCITPGVGFTQTGNRLGLGLGYYDRWFSMHPGILKIAPAYEIQIVNHLPVDSHDIGIDIMVTEDRTIRV